MATKTTRTKTDEARLTSLLKKQTETPDEVTENEGQEIETLSALKEFKSAPVKKKVETVKVKNTSKRILRVGKTVLLPGKPVPVSKEESEILLLSENVKEAK